MAMRVVPVACLADNYAYLLVCEATNAAVLVDPSEPEPVLRAARDAKVDVRGIWNTHHHHDHTGGNEAVARELGLDTVAGHVSDKGRIPGQTRFLEAGTKFPVGELTVEILHIPGHTLGAIAYVVREKGGGTALFTGDTMFHAGCGRLFEGTPAAMHASLSSLVAEGDDARVYPGHEYTVNNLRFAHAMEPGNAAVASALRDAQALRERGQPTVGTPIARERATNPFVRTHSAELRSHVGVAPDADDVTVFAATRKAKDGFR